jgi:hypothetical protein
MVDAFAMGESETGSAGVGGEERDVDDDVANMATGKDIVQARARDLIFWLIL